MFQTAEQALIEKIGSGILQSKLTNNEIGYLQRLMQFPNNHTLRPKYTTRHTVNGTMIVPHAEKVKVDYSKLAKKK